MNGPIDTKRRTVLKTLGAGVAGGMALIGTVGAHGDDDWGTPAWLLTDVWEMADGEPSGEEPTDHHSHVPIYYIAPGANPDAGYDCPQFAGKEFREWANLDDSEADFEAGAWKSVDIDQTLHDVEGTDEPPITEFTVLWHVNFVFEGDASEPYHPDNLVNGTENGLKEYGPFIDSGKRILEAKEAGKVKVVEAPFVFNCPGRPAQGDHLNYC